MQFSWFCSIAESNGILNTDYLCTAQIEKVFNADCGVNV